MLNRCRNKADRSYHHYGGRGIRVCKRWEKFANFIADMGRRPDGLLLERIDNDGHYQPSNCKWATPLEQNHNRRPRDKRAMAKRLKRGTKLDLRIIIPPDLGDALRQRAEEHERTLEQEMRYILRQTLARENGEG